MQPFELDIDPARPDRFQEILEGSLLFIQMKSDPNAQITHGLATDILRSRIHYIRSRYPQSNIRRRLYKLGMALSDCETIESSSEKLLELFQEAVLWPDWDEEQRFDLLLRISQFVVTLNEIKPKKDMPEQWPTILSHWLQGISTTEMIKNDEISQFTTSPAELCLFLEDICGYRLPWGINSIMSYLTMFTEERGESVPSICSYFPGMFKYGVNDPVAVCIVPYLDQARDLALAAAKVCPYDIDQPEIIVAWFMNLSLEDLLNLGLERSTAERTITVRDAFQRLGLYTGGQGRRDRIRISTRDVDIVQELNIGDRVLVLPRPYRSHRHYEVFTVGGTRIGRYERTRRPIPDWWNNLHLVDSVITAIEEQEEGLYVLSIKLQEI